MKNRNNQTSLQKAMVRLCKTKITKLFSKREKTVQGDKGSTFDNEIICPHYREKKKKTAKTAS